MGSSTLADRQQDGQPPKRRGPKPDSKPALTRRQELNRQAQRFVIRLLLISRRSVGFDGSAPLEAKEGSSVSVVSQQSTLVLFCLRWPLKMALQFIAFFKELLSGHGKRA